MMAISLPPLSFVKVNDVKRPPPKEVSVNAPPEMPGFARGRSRASVEASSLEIKTQMGVRSLAPDLHGSVTHVLGQAGFWPEHWHFVDCLVSKQQPDCRFSDAVGSLG